MATKRGASIESSLSALFSALAQVLIPLEITPARLSQIARISFVKACSVKAKKRSSGKPHLALIAAKTGLSRVEVKKIVASNFQVGKQSPETAPRYLRVLLAWHEKRPYIDQGRPISLRVEGKPPSFDALCRQYSGDIPHKVILSELEKSGSVHLNKARTRVSVARLQLENKKLRSSETALEFAAQFVAQSLGENYQAIKRRQKVRFAPSISPAYAEKAIAGRINDLLDQIPDMFPRKPGNRSGEIQLFALVARKQQKKTAD